MKKLITTLFAIALSFGAFSQQNDTMFVHTNQFIYEFATKDVDSIVFYRTQSSSTIPIGSVALNHTYLEMPIGDTLTLQATVLPANATIKGVVWASSNPQVATVINGKIFALSEGTAIISVVVLGGHEDGNKIATCNLNVVTMDYYFLLNNAYGTLGYFLTSNSHDAANIMSLQLAGDLMTEDMVQRYNHWYYFDYEIDNNILNFRRPTHSWQMMYTVIEQVNEVIGMIDPLTIDPNLQTILGQCLALRAFSYHVLIQRFQQTYMGNQNAPGVPLRLASNEVSNYSRNTVGQVYTRIEADLTKAINLLTAARPSKDYINKAVAQGLLARVYMCMHRFAEAEVLAQQARQGFPIMNAPLAGGGYGYNSENNSEWMWGLKATPNNTMMYASFQSQICSDGAGYGGPVIGAYKAMDNRLFNQMNTTDVRRNLHFMNTTTDVFYNMKFKDVPNWLMDNIYMRSSEMLLIEAEAQAQQGKNAQAANTLMGLMQNRDYAYNKTSATVEDIFLQKRLECWGEGVIFYDYLRLKKTVDRAYTTPYNNHLEQVMLCGTNWRFIYQIPQVEIDNNPHISATDNNPAQGNVVNCDAAPATPTITGLDANPCPQVTVMLTATVNPTPNPVATFEWRKDGTVISGQTAANLTVTASGSYTVRAVNTIGASNWSVAKTVTISECVAPATPTITGLDSNTCPARIVTLTATVPNVPYPDPTFEWRKNGTVITGQTAITLTVNSTGSYTVKAINTMGESSWSAAKTVTIDTNCPAALTLAGDWGVTSWVYFATPRYLANWDLEIAQVGDTWVFQDEDLPIVLRMDEDGDYYIESFNANNPNLNPIDALDDGTLCSFWQVVGGYITRTGTTNNIYSIQAPFRLYLEISEDGTSWQLPYQLQFNDGAITLIMGVATQVAIPPGNSLGFDPGNYWYNFQGEMNCVKVGNKGAGKIFLPHPKNQNLDASMLQLIDAKRLPHKASKTTLEAPTSDNLDALLDITKPRANGTRK
ncbi:MAG: RagB/SusD family nutrient uptake outer membrane protein [Bacteroidales bacterium]|nr:RagB/SusD family nutrient uptake outer membrane protein [Bacteroidales bacterium]